MERRGGTPEELRERADRLALDARAEPGGPRSPHSACSLDDTTSGMTQVDQVGVGTGPPPRRSSTAAEAG